MGQDAAVVKIRDTLIQTFTVVKTVVERSTGDVPTQNEITLIADLLAQGLVQVAVTLKAMS